MVQQQNHFQKMPGFQRLFGMTYIGIGTVPLRAIKMHRQGLMTELNEGYFRDAVGYLDAEEAKIDTPTLFDLIEAG